MHSYNFIDLSNNRFGRLTVIKLDTTKNGTRWLCKCDCGNIKSINAYLLKSNATKSCGCYNKEVARSRMTGKKFGFKHGLSKHPLMSVWDGMVQRCTNRNNINFSSYGGRGIDVCDEWKNNYKSFYDWAINNNWSKGLQIDRINNNGNYNPNNCRIVTRSVNMRNTSRNKMLSNNGVRKCVADWAIEFNVRSNTIITQLRRGWTEERIFNKIINDHEARDKGFKKSKFTTIK